MKSSKKSAPTRRSKKSERLAIEVQEVPRIPMTIGYCRVSTDEQHVDLQKRALHEFGCHHILEETVSSRATKRRYFNLLKKFVESGDTIAVNSFSRLSRNAKDLLAFIDEMKERGIVRIISMTQREINPYTTAGRLMITITGGIDEHEVNQITDRTKAGMAEKMLQGVRMGRPRVVTETVAAKIKRDYEHSSVPVLAKKYGVSKSSIYKCINA